jgi:uncharacterized protein
MTGTSAGFPQELAETPDMGIVLSDGCRLSARVWMPTDAIQAPVPAILEYIPYRKRDGTLPRDELMHPWFAGHGYAAVRVDMRGNGDSDGLMDDEYTAQELSDACEVIGWLSRQPWCSGQVGMMGKSWGGFNCLQTAALRPPALKAVVSVMSTTDRFADDIHFKGGCLMGENLGWAATMLSYSSRPPDPALRADWRKVWLDRLQADPFLAPRWAGHQSRDAYWKHGSVCEDWAAIKVPVLSIGGWADGYMNTVSHLVSNLKVPVAGIVGPWVHQYPHSALPGPQAGFLQLALRWWDRWLKDIPNGAEGDPVYRVYMIDSHPPDASAPSRPGRWLAETAWPSPHVTTVSHPLSAKGRLGGAGGRIGLAISTPQHLGLQAGEYFPVGLNAEMPGDQREDDALSATFDTDPLLQGIELMGAAVLRATVSSDRPLAFLVARLCDVALDGASSRIAHGMLNLCHRESRESPTPLASGNEVDITLTLDQMAWRLAPGHRLRLSLSTTYFPFLWPSPETATVTLHQGSLDLPVHDGTHRPCILPEPQTAPPWRHRVLRKGAASRRIERDLVSGRHSLVVEDDTGDTENLTHGLITGETVRERWTVHPDDPLSAEAEIVWEQRLSRGPWSVRTEARTRMMSSASHLRMTAELVAWEGSAEIFRRTWDENVPRAII